MDSVSTVRYGFGRASPFRNNVDPKPSRLMREILFQYESVNPTTWAYLSSLLVIGLYFKFNRVWSVRNLDVLLIIALAPGLLMVYFGQQSINRATSVPSIQTDAAVLAPKLEGEAQPPPALGVAAVPEEEPARPSRQELLQIGKTLEKAGYVWLFCISGLIVVRLFVDPTMVRRPMLEPNLSIGGMTFITCALFIFLMMNIIVGRPSDADLRGVREASKSNPKEVEESLRHFGPGYRMLLLVPRIPTYQLAQTEPTESELETSEKITIIVTKTMAILANLALISGIVLVGYRHFDSIRMGVGAAMFYFLLPYAAVYTGRIDHVLPAALLVWAIFFYRTPLWSGVFMGLAIGTCYYPLFLLPLWFSYYWERGRARFLIGVVSTLVLLALSLAFTSPDFETYLHQFRAMFGLWLPRDEGYTGFWNYYFNSNAYRIPVLSAFAVVSIAFAIWPAQKNLGTLLSCTAGLMVAAQFWHANDGTTYIAWYMPLMLLTIFRPNLEDRVALRVIGEGWLKRGGTGSPSTDEEKQAA